MAGRTRSTGEPTPGRATGKKALCPEVVGTTVNELPLRPAQCRAYLRRTLAKEFRGIVDGFVQSAKGGSCQHVKLATELMKTPARTRVRGRGKVEELLKKLDREEAGRGERRAMPGERG